MLYLLVIVSFVYLLQVNLNSMLVVGWCALCCIFQRDDPGIFVLMTGCHLLHLRQMFGGAFKSISFFFFPLPVSGRSPDMTEILLTGTLSLNSSKFYVLFYCPTISFSDIVF